MNRENTPRNLINLLDMDDEFIIDLKYATADNFTHEIIYQTDKCYIDRNTALKLINAKNLAKKERNLRIKVWDAFRPISAQQRFWDILPDNNFVAYPPDMDTLKEFKNSHMNGQCVDVTLVNRDGSEIPMPSGFDDFSEKARLDYSGTTGTPRENGEYLRDIMVKSGFTPYEGEWWHFYDHETKPVRYSDLSILTT